MARTKVAIAGQGGGSQTAFTAGALKTLCEAKVNEEDRDCQHQRDFWRSHLCGSGMVRP